MSDGVCRLAIPRDDPINDITMGAIARDAGLTPQQFRDLHHRSFAVTAERRQLLWEEMDRCLELADRLSARLSAADQVD